MQQLFGRLDILYIVNFIQASIHGDKNMQIVGLIETIFTSNPTDLPGTKKNTICGELILQF